MIGKRRTMMSLKTYRKKVFTKNAVIDFFLISFGILAAGLGLPSLLAARYAYEVHASDHIPEAVELMKRSADLNGILNMKCSLLDWNCLPENIRTDILLLSDINYDPSICRNIMVDIRYVLFIIDKYAGAGHLVKEMKLVHPKGGR